MKPALYFTCCILLGVPGIVIAQNNVPVISSSPDNNQSQVVKPAANPPDISPVIPGTNTPVKVNYTRVFMPLQPVKTEPALNSYRAQVEACLAHTTYTDGLNRPLQTVIRKTNTSGKDIVHHHIYDAQGREPVVLLPYLNAGADVMGEFSLAINTGLHATYTELGYTSERYLYNEIQYEPSPLNRNIQVQAAGESWTGSDRGVVSDFHSNEAEADIKAWQIDFAQGSLPYLTPAVSRQNYPVNTLWIEVTLDEDYDRGADDNAVAKSFFDRRGKLVMRSIENSFNSAQQLRTYFVYDKYDRLRLTIPPKAVEAVAANGWTVSQTIADNLCFRYEYDMHGNMIVLKKPGVGEMRFVYSHRHQVVLSQDPLQRTENKWVFEKRDPMGHLMQTGIYTGGLSQAALQNIIFNIDGTSDAFLLYLRSEQGYAGNYYEYSYPSAEVYVSYYYHNYDFLPPGYTAETMERDGYANTIESANRYGMLTGIRAKVSDNSGDLLTVNFYNTRSELVQVEREELDHTKSVLSLAYAFNGTLTQTDFRYRSVTIAKTYQYDGAGRLIRINHKVNDAPAFRRLAIYNYDALGRMKSKELGSMAYPVKFEYNIRNWITGINKAYVYDRTLPLFFGIEVSYESGYTKTYNNGRIAGIKWRSKGSSKELRSYGYEYDYSGQMKSADYVQRVESSGNTVFDFTKSPKDFTTSNITFDPNGNIQSLKHMGMNASKQKIVLDDLSYTYNPGSNFLKNVEESPASQSKDLSVHDGLNDFRNVSASTDYDYDANGNLSADANRGITSISNNWFTLNKPLEIVYSQNQKIGYVYDALGSMLQKRITQVRNGVATTTIFDFAGEITFKDNEPVSIAHEEGRIRVSPRNQPGPAYTYSYDYFLKDHLQNVRSVITEEATPGFDELPQVEIDESGHHTLPTNASPAPDPMVYLATSEVPNDTIESLLFERVRETRVQRPLASAADENRNAAHLDASGSEVLGPGKMLKVMAGDALQVNCKAFYKSLDDYGRPIALDILVSSIVGALLGNGGPLADGGTGSLAGSAASNISSSQIASMLQTFQQARDPDKPCAYLNYLMFDESMQLVEDASGAVQVTQADQWASLEVEKFGIPQNGFMYVFTSNQSNVGIYTDDLMIVHWQGKLLEEFHYYPYGLPFEVSSSLGVAKNNIRYNSQAFEQDEFRDNEGSAFGLNLYDFAARSYDAQIGRWWQTDPLMQHASPFLAMGNNPSIFTDPLGLMDGDESKPKPRRIETVIGADGLRRSMRWDNPDQVTITIFDPAAKEISLGAGGAVNSYLEGFQTGIDEDRTARAAVLTAQDNLRDNAGRGENAWMSEVMATGNGGGTWDPVTNQRIRQLDSRLQGPATDFINAAQTLGINLRITQGFRSIAEQQALYNQGRTTPGPIVTYARGGMSYHNYGLAFDVVIMQNGRALVNTPISRQIAEIGISFGFEWGGDWSPQRRDLPHFQMTFGQSILDLLKH